MKAHFVFLALAMVAVGCAAPSEPNDAAESSDEALSGGWQNVLTLSVPAAGYVNTLQTPHLTLRPVRGIYMRMSWPLACNAQISQMALYGTSLAGQRLPLAATLVGGPQLEASGNVAAYYMVNGGAGATVREIGLFGFLGSACSIDFEQSNTLTQPPPPGGGGGTGGQAISGYNFSGFGQCRSLPADQACPALANAVTDACLDRGGRTSYCSDCSVMCNVPLQ